MNKPAPKPKASSKDMMSALLGSSVPAVAPEAQPLNHTHAPPLPAPRIDFVPFASRVTVENDLSLTRAAFWLPGKTKQELLNDALTAYLANIPESKKPTSKERL